jgi:ppGpp synthetase/RelA/SpoT-type nucleotidyltranferase
MENSKKSINSLRRDYEQLTPVASRYTLALREEFEQLVANHDLSLGVPIEYRVKTWDSITEKIERLKLSLKTIRDLDDFVGLRLIFPFKRDINKIHELISQTFEVIQYEDTASRLDETQFGYQSVHYIIKLPQNWLKIPSFRDFGDFRAEIQVRTLAQHIWATASHLLQYKQAISVPPPVRRSIHRVSAILETVDLEFERVLQERDSYITSIDIPEEDATLNVDLIQRIMDESLPLQNKYKTEDYANLVQDLLHFDINTVGKLHQLIRSNLDKVLEEDRRQVTEHLKGKDLIGFVAERVRSGVYFSHTGLIRKAVSLQFGESWEKYMKEKYRLPSPEKS